MYIHKIYLCTRKARIQCFFKNQIDAGNLRMIFASLQDKAEALATKKVGYFISYNGTYFVF